MDDEARDQLERMALGESLDPIELPLSLLEAITKKFSDEHIIGSGGFANVYKGILQNGAVVAVKKLFDRPAMDDLEFTKEVRCLINARHKNIVRFLGYYADKRLKVAHYGGKMVMAGVRQWLLCFEFLPRGSLDRYINDADQEFEWSRHWYKIIKGICEGLHYLHQNKIVHLDLKPANILLNCNMEPKIADFGVSRCFDEKQSRAMTSNVVGTLGYMAPEFIDGQITFKSDIYSLGAIIMQILTGQKTYCAVENVLKSWSNRFGTSQTSRELGHVTVCAEIGNACLDTNPDKRPSIESIIKDLEKMESKNDPIGIDVCSSSVTPQASKGFTELHLGTPTVPQETSSDSNLDFDLDFDFGSDSDLNYGPEKRSIGSTEISKLMVVHPLELRFPFKPKKRIHWPVNLTNRTDKYVGAWLASFEIMEPNSSLSILMTMKHSKPPSWKTHELKVWMIVMSSKEHLEQLKKYFDRRKMTGDQKDLKKVRRFGGEVHQAILTAVICDPASCQPVIHKRKLIATRKFVLGNVSCIDVHPRETWILVGCEQRFACIWNYKTKERVMVWQQVTSRKPGVLDLFKQGANTSSVTSSITSARFFVREHWCATGDDEGWVHVYAYPAKDKVKELEAHQGKPVDYLAVHPTYPFLVTSSSKDTSIKLWDWGQGWICTRTFDNCAFVTFLKWNPSDNSTLFSASNFEIKIWDIHFPDPITTLDMEDTRKIYSYPLRAWWLKERRNNACYLYTATSHQHLMAFAFQNYMDIWDLQRKECVQKLSLQFFMYILDIACHPTLPLLFVIASTRGSTQDAYIYLWDARTYRVEKIVRLTEVPRGKLFVIDTEDLTRLIAISGDGISIVEINLSRVGID